MRSTFLFLLFIAISVPSLIALTNCVNPDVNGPSQAWVPGALITVIASKFPRQLQSCVQSAFDNWNKANQTNGSGVKYNVTFNDTPIDPSTNNGYQVTYQTVTLRTADGNAPLPGETGGKTNGQNRVTGVTNIDPHVTNCAAVTETLAHEIGHTEGLGECSQCKAPGTSVMIGVPCVPDSTGTKCASPQVPDYNNTTAGLPSPTTCDNSTINNQVYSPPGGGGGGNPCLNGATATPTSSTIGSGSGGYFIAPVCSPIIIDTKDEGFLLTSAQAGVTFDITGTGQPIQLAWTTRGSHNAFLSLPGPDGLVHNGKELFGNFTTQPASAHPNGFLALAEFDRPENGGNSDRVIDEKDAVFSRLRLWIDANHDGICQTEELHTLPELGVFSLALKYSESRRTDDFGNQFRYRARLNPGPNDGESDVGRWTYDVFLATTNK
ncbi:MAG TPA: hypothetical protein VG649_07365 [Candidatus Angelobacter sp.]|jgi:hypothetical protein|nr:hypothetical protein [Candidatus Angelobacter sp.]